ncbi:GLPGLI family protein [Epilithonimonas sp. UC225_85]|uniref:GLPGLI family protein n=1 Tax=Epilithonimonas sp. UC225_85 TaxID=3350167 RepID=UPI0036D3AB58
MKKLLLFFILFGTLAIAQNKRFIYEYRFIPDSRNVSEIKTEMMFLDTSKNGSKYYSYTVFNSDSLMKAYATKQLKVNDSAYVDPALQIGIVRYSVIKTYPDYKTNIHRRFGMYAYKISEDRKINWKISSEKEKVGEWIAQKAETDFAGRHWTAWFSTEIPIQDGPYKFHGLPGLIVKIEDETGSHKMELKGIKNIQRDLNINVIEPKQIAINSNKFQKLEKEQKERFKNQINNDNNHIELDIVK